MPRPILNPHQRVVSRLRWLFALLWLAVACWYWLYFLGPMISLTMVGGWLGFAVEVPERLLRVVNHYWSPNHAWVVVPHGTSMLALAGLDPLDWYGARGFGELWFLPVGTVLAVGVGMFAFLRVGGPDDGGLLARAEPTPGSILVSAIAIGMLNLAVVIFLLVWTNRYEAVAEPVHRMYPLGWASPPRPPLAEIALLAALTGAALPLVRMFYQGQQRYWRLERLSLVFVIAAGLLLGLTLWVGRSPWGYGYGSNPVGLHWALWLAGTVLVWALGCRVLLVFRLRRYELAARTFGDPTCFACGYDLRGSPASATACPECGAAMTVGAGAAAGGGGDVSGGAVSGTRPAERAPS